MNTWEKIISQPVGEVKRSLRGLTLGDVVFMHDYYSGVDKNTLAKKHGLSVSSIWPKVSKINKKIASKAK